jgi:hypothetical protein
MSQYDLPRKVKTERIELKAPPPVPTAAAPVPTAPPPAAVKVKGDPRGLTQFIQETAKKYGIDPATALKVAKSEGLAQFYGDNGASGGAFQLYTKGGLGNEFKKETGLDPLDPANEKATIDYALKRAAQGGWGPWYGAAKVGIGNFDGIGDRPGTTPAIASTAPPAIATVATPFTDPAANTETASVSTTTPGEDTTVAEDKEKDKKKKDYREIAGDSLSDLGKIYSDGPVARNARTPSSPANVAAAQLPMPQGPVSMIDAKHAEMQRQQLALAMQRLNSGKLV